jgi:hypothetical protein
MIGASEIRSDPGGMLAGCSGAGGVDGAIEAELHGVS